MLYLVGNITEGVANYRQTTVSIVSDWSQNAEHTYKPTNIANQHDSIRRHFS